MKKRLFVDQNGQSMVEFGLTFGLFMAFIYGLLGIGLWGTSSMLVQEAAHSAARCYAGTGDSARAAEEARLFIGCWAFPFIENHTLSIEESGGRCTVIIMASPRESIRQLWVFHEGAINRESQATMDYALRYQYQFTGD